MSDFEITKPYSLDVDTKAIKSSISETYDSSSQVANRDGNLIERTEFIIDTMLHSLPARVEQSDAHTVSEGTYAYFSVQLFNMDGDPYLATAIDISSATLTLEKSTSGGAFSSVGITQPTLSKGLGHIDTSILFKADEWEVDDLYKLSLSGVTVTNGTVHTLQHFVWNNLVSAVNDIDTEVDTILDIVTFPSVDSANDTTIAEVIGTKGDTVDGTSIISRIKQAIAQLVLVLADTLTIKTETNKIAGEIVKTGLIKTETDKIPATITKIDAIKSKTDNLPSNPASQTNIDLIKTETDKIPATIIKVDAVKAKTDNLPSNPASQTNVDLIKTETDKIPATITKIDGEVIKTSAIKAKTDNLPSDPASQTNIDLIKAKTDNLPATPANEATLTTILTEVVEVEKHLHSNECWFGDAVSPIAGVHEADEDSLIPFVIDSGNNTWGTAVCIIGTSDTPCSAGKTKFDIHEILITATERTNEPYIIRWSWGNTEAEAISAGNYSKVAIYPTTTARSAPITIQSRRITAGTKVWMNCKCANNTGTINFLIGFHEYDV